MYAETCGIHMTTDNSYFDITHSFKVGQSTYHILGLRKDYPTYGNNYYVFNCTSENSPSELLPSIYSSRILTQRRSMSARDQTLITKTRQRTTSTHESSRSRTTLLKKMECDTTAIKEALSEIIKSEHQTLVTSIRQEMNADKKLLIQSIEKEKDVFAQAVSTTNNEKQTIVRLLEEHKSSLQSTYERHISTTISSIELLKTTITETINAQYERLRILDQFQLTLNETIEREVDKTMMKHLEAYRATSVDINTIQQVQNTLIETFERSYTTRNNDNENEMKQFVAKQFHHLTDLLKKQLETISIELSAIKQSQSTFFKGKKNSSTTNSENSDNEALKQLFVEHRQYLTNLIERQSQTLPLELIKETVVNVMKQQTSIGISTTRTTNTTFIPTDVVYDQRLFEALTPLFVEQRQYFTDLIEKQSQTLSLKLIKETVVNVLKQQTSIGISNTEITGTTFRPNDVVYDQCSFKVSIQTAEFAQVFAELTVGGKKYDKELYTLCQRDPSQSDIVNCFVVPPLKTGSLALTIYAKTKSESEYRAAISVQMPVQNITQGITFPKLYPPFQDHQCILIEPFRRLVQPNEEILIHMVLAGVRRVKIRNGDHENVLGQVEFRNGIIKTKVLVRGDVIIYGQWDGRTDLAVCAFEMDKGALE